MVNVSCKSLDCKWCKYRPDKEGRWICGKDHITINDKGNCEDWELEYKYEYGNEDVEKGDNWNKEREESKTRNDLLIVKAKPGLNIKTDMMEHWKKEILKMKETGLVVLPWFLDAIVVPEGVEVQFIDPKSSCVLEEGLECQTSDQS